MKKRLDKRGKKLKPLKVDIDIAPTGARTKIRVGGKVIGLATKVVVTTEARGLSTVELTLVNVNVKIKGLSYVLSRMGPAVVPPTKIPVTADIRDENFP